MASGSNNYENNTEQEDDREGETSGYASDAGERNDYWNQLRQQRYRGNDKWTNDTERCDKMSTRFNKQAHWIPSNR